MTQMNTFLMVSREVLEQGKSVRFKANGWSMRPLIQNGDLLTARPIDGRSACIGDIVFYTTARDSVVVHRMIGRRRNSGRTIVLVKGDACCGSPDRIAPENILGRVISIERRGRIKRLDTVWQKALSLIFAAASTLMLWILPAFFGNKKMRLHERWQLK